ncbi:MAG: hypothetical protein ACRBHB_02425 [Arenicella sp.]
MSLVDEDGYFIEGGGFDSSYNGVATSLGFQLAMVGFEDSLGSISNEAIQWQAGRIKPDGEVSTKGNSRVNPRVKNGFLVVKKRLTLVILLKHFCLLHCIFNKTNTTN